jgi:hypothetical protein
MSDAIRPRRRHEPDDDLPRRSIHQPDNDPFPPGKPASTKWRKIALFSGLGVVLIAGILILCFLLLKGHTALSPFATDIPQEAVVAMLFNLEEFRKVPGLDAEIAEMDGALKEFFRDLNLEPGSAKLNSLFLSATKEGETIRIWVFDQPIQIGTASAGRFRMAKIDDATLWQDKFAFPNHWCVDNKGRLLHGPKDLIESAIARKKTGKATRASEELSRWGSEVPSNSLIWTVADFSRTEAKEFKFFPRNLAEDLKGTRINGQFFFMDYSEKDGPVLHGKWFCPTHSDAKSCADSLEGLKKHIGKLAEGLFAGSYVKNLNKVLKESQFEVEEKEIKIQLSIPLAFPRIGFEFISKSFRKGRELVEEQFRRAFHKQMRQGEIAFGKQNYEEAKLAFSEALNLYPEDLLAKGKLEEAKRALDGKKQSLETKRQLDLTLEEVAKALASSELGKAREKLAAAEKIQPNDPRLVEFEKRLKDMENEVKYQANVSDGDKALSQSNLELALTHFQNANRSQPNREKVRATILAIETFQKAAKLLEEGKDFRTQKKVSQAYDQAKKIKDTIFGDFRSKIEGDIRFKGVLEKMTEDTSNFLWEMFKDLRELSLEKKDKAQQAWNKKDFPLAVKENGDSQLELAKAKDFLQGLKSFPIKELSKEIEKKEKELDEEYSSLDLVRRKAEGLILLEQGKDYLKDGHLLLTQAKRDSFRLLEAQEVFKNALKKIEAAAKCPGIDVKEELKKAQIASDQVAKLIRPINLDFTKSADLKGWAFPKDQWSHLEGRLQSAKVATSNLSFPGIEFPADFVLTMEISIVKGGKFRNDYWKSVNDFLTVRLGGNDSPELVISLGKDPNVKFQDLAQITLGKKSYSLPSVDKASSVTVQLVRKNGTAALIVQERTIGDSFSLDGQLNQLSIAVNNGKGVNGEFNAFLGIFRVNLEARIAKKK